MNLVSYIELKFKLKIDPKMLLLKTLKKLGKPGQIKKKQVETLSTFNCNCLKTKKSFRILYFC